MEDGHQMSQESIGSPSFSELKVFQQTYEPTYRADASLTAPHPTTFFGSNQVS